MSSSVSILGLTLAIIASACWAAFDVVRKRVGERARATSALAWLNLWQVLALSPLLATGASLSASDNSVFLPPLPAFTLDYAWMIGASFLINIVANLMFLRAVQISPLSLTTPYLSFTPVFTALLALLVYNEAPGAWGWAGIAVVVAGAFFLNRKPGDRGWLAPLLALKEERGSVYMLGVSVMWSVTPLLDKGGSERVGPIWHTFILAALLAITFFIWLFYKDGNREKMMEEWRARRSWIMAGGLVSAGAMACQFASYAWMDIALVETIKRAIGVTVAMLAGYLLFGEREIGRRLVAALVMVVGVGMILFTR